MINSKLIAMGYTGCRIGWLHLVYLDVLLLFAKRIHWVGDAKSQTLN